MLSRLHAPLRLVISTLFVFSGLTLNHAILTSAADPTWSAAPPMPYSSLRGQTATALPDGRVLVAGGVSDPLGSAVFDPKTGSWSERLSMPTPQNQGHVAVTLTDGRALVIGALSVAAFDPQSNSWFPRARCLGCAPLDAVRLNDGRVFVISRGRGAEVYEPTTDTWTWVQSLSQSRSDATATLLNDGRVLVVGADASDPASHGTAEIYDPVRDTWDTASNLEIGDSMLYGHRAVRLLDGRVLVSGGVTTSWQSSTGVYLYDPGLDIWSTVASLSAARSRHVMALLPDGRVLVTSGLIPTNVSEVYDPWSNRWSSYPTINARADGSMAVVPPGLVLAVGGHQGSPQAPVPPETFSGPLNTDPIANAGPDQEQAGMAGLLTAVRLDGSASFDADGDELVYTWQDGSRVLAVTTDPVDALDVFLGPGVHEITLTVSDRALGLASRDTVVITVSDWHATLAVLESSFHGCQGDLETARSEKTALAAQVADLQTQIASKTGQIAALENQVLALQTEVTAQTNQIDGLVRLVGELVTELERRQIAIDSLLAQVTSGEAFAREIGARIDAIEADLRVRFADPAFTIPGTTPLERFRSLAAAVVELNLGRQQGIYQALSGR